MMELRGTVEGGEDVKSGGGFSVGGVNFSGGVRTLEDTMPTLFCLLPLFDISSTPSLPPLPCHLPGVDTGCFQHWYTDLEHSNLGVLKFNLK